MTRPAKGSSPLTRGAQHHHQAQTNVAQLIPAHAGSTATSKTARTSARAHPRSRGEHVLAGGDVELDGGSSPLTRGALKVECAALCGAGLIPAHAGSTLDPRCPPFGVGAHPRSRGEHTLGSMTKALGEGSSPLTRGARSSPRWQSPTRGLIPAHAGSTTRKPLGRPAWTAHPRSRGEHLQDSLPIVRRLGSSPLTRGAQTPLCKPYPAQRLIPAHAGSTSS